MAIDDRLTSLKTDTFSKTREEKMEDLFAQKDVGLLLGHLCPQRPFGFIVLLVRLDGRGGAAQLD